MNNNFSRICNTALLRTGFINSKNINSAYERLFLTLIEHKQYEEIDATKLCEDFNDFFNSDINSILAKNFLIRLEKNGYVKRIDKVSFSCRLTKIGELGLLAEYEKLLNDTNLLIDNLISFLKSVGETKCSREQATKLLTNSIENTLSNLGQDSDNGNSDKERYLMYLYLNKIKAEQPRLFEIYKNMMYGSILSSFIDGNERYLTANNNFFKNATFYLDSGFVFNLLGLNNNSNGSEYEDMIKTLQKLGAHIKIFDHILHDEIEFIIFNSIGYVENPLYKPSKSPNVTNYFVENGFTKTDVEEYYHSLENKLNSYGITIEDYSINYNEEDTAFEKNFYDMITEDYKTSDKYDEDKERTYWNDAKSLFLVHKLRKGKTYTKLSDTVHVLLTTNAGIGRVANEFNNKIYKGNNTPYALTDLSLNTLLYISYGNYSEFTNERFAVPAAFHGFGPSKEWLAALDKELDSAKEKGVLDEKEIINWKTSKFLLNELVRTTKGNPELFNKNTIEETFKQYKRDADQMVETANQEADKRILQMKNQLIEERTQNISEKAALKDQIISTISGGIENLKEQKNQLIQESSDNVRTIKTKTTAVHAVLTSILAIIAFIAAFLYHSLNANNNTNIWKYCGLAIIFIVLTIVLNVIWKLLNNKNENSKVAKHFYKKNVARINAIASEIQVIDAKIGELEKQIFAVQNSNI